MKKIILFSFLLSLFFGVTAFATEAKKKADRPVIATSKTPIIEIKLPANPSTGFSWYLLKYDEKLLTPLTEKYYPPKKSMPGAVGYDLWRFRVLSRALVLPKITYVKFVYMRPWTMEGATKKKIAVITREN